MSSFNDFTRCFQVNEAMSAGRVVALSNNGKIGLAACDAANSLGVLEEDCTANTYENPKVRLWGCGTRLIAVTNTPLTAGDTVVIVTSGYVAGTNGRVGDTGVEIGIMIDTTGNSQNGKLFEVAIQGPRIT
jgi:hypothetical protein